MGLREVSGGFRGVLRAPIAVVMRMWSAPDLTLLNPPGRDLFLVAEAPI